MATILDGRFVQSVHKEQLKKDIESLPEPVTLFVVQVGENPQSTNYIAYKKKFGEEIGVRVIHKKLSNDISQSEIISIIKNANSDDSITGIIVQLPLPEHVVVVDVIESINPLKDVDGLTSVNTTALFENRECIIPATARGIISILDQYNIPIANAHAVVVGRGILVGKPVAQCLRNRGARVVVCHRGTPDLIAETKHADILIVAAGVKGLIEKEHVNEKQVIIDAGLTPVLEEGKNKLYGDVSFSEVSPMVQAITPSPGGVGPMTIVSLFENVLQAYYLQHRT